MKKILAILLAFMLTGTLILFVVLAVVMYFTRNLNKKEETQPE